MSFKYAAGVDPDQLQPEFRQAVESLLGGFNYTEWVITCGYRSPDQQAMLYAQGRTAPGPIITWAKPGTSAHENGLAVDVALEVDGHLSWNNTSGVWDNLWRLIEQSPILHSGHDFPKGETDDDHIERYRFWEHLPTLRVV